MQSDNDVLFTTTVVTRLVRFFLLLIFLLPVFYKTKYIIFCINLLWIECFQVEKWPPLDRLELMPSRSEHD